MFFGLFHGVLWLILVLILADEIVAHGYRRFAGWSDTSKSSRPGSD